MLFRVMDDKAFFVLDAVKRGGWSDIQDHGDWLSALKTIRWIVETADGPALTPDGRQALDEMSVRRRKTMNGLA